MSSSIYDSVMNIQFNDSISGVSGELRPLTQKDLECEALLEILAFSRNTYRGSFFTDSMSDLNTTRNFLQESLKSKNRFLFLVFVFTKASNDSDLYGHVGYEVMEDNRIEIINVMRVPNINSKLKMHQPLEALLLYLTNHFPKSQLFLKVLSSNDRAISMYSKCGFRASTEESANQRRITIMTRN